MQHNRFFNPYCPNIPGFKMSGRRNFIEPIIDSIKDTDIIFLRDTIYGAVDTEFHISLKIFPETIEQETILKLLLS